MNLSPKVGPLVAELLSGLTALFLVYIHLHGISFGGIENLPSGAFLPLAVLAWISGTFFDLIRNLFVESFLDCVARRFGRLGVVTSLVGSEELNWAFFFNGDRDRLANLESYFWSFYLLDFDMAIAILLAILLTIFIPNGFLDIKWRVGLVVVALLFAFDAISLRKEIKGLISYEKPT